MRWWQSRRARGWAYQIALVLALLALGSWLLGNTLANTLTRANPTGALSPWACSTRCGSH